MEEDMELTPQNKTDIATIVAQQLIGSGVDPDVEEIRAILNKLTAPAIGLTEAQMRIILADELGKKGWR
jgi:hypothetical protein